jgi:hypothetical protein
MISGFDDMSLCESVTWSTGSIVSCLFVWVRAVRLVSSSWSLLCQMELVLCTLAPECISHSVTGFILEHDWVDCGIDKRPAIDAGGWCRCMILWSIQFRHFHRVIPPKQNLHALVVSCWRLGLVWLWLSIQDSSLISRSSHILLRGADSDSWDNSTVMIMFIFVIHSINNSDNQFSLETSRPSTGQECRHVFHSQRPPFKFIEQPSLINRFIPQSSFSYSHTYLPFLPTPNNW